MKPPPFDYIAATSVEDAVALLTDERDSRILAGGQSLLPILNLRLGSPELLIDIGRIDELGTIELSDHHLQIGAAVTQQSVLDDAGVGRRWPLLTDALRHIGHAQIRNRGTVCGSLAHNDPQAELPAVAMALGAEVVARSANGSRRVAADELFTGPFSTSLAPDELLVSVEFPAQPSGWAFQEFAVRPGDFALAGVACAFDPIHSAARVVMFGSSGCPMQATAVEEALLAGAGAGDLEQAAAATVESLDATGDIHASAASRRTLMTKLLIEAASQAHQRARTETDR
jgi:aerobic carbon-monoxide dehydrogenase medium subunit